MKKNLFSLLFVLFFPLINFAAEKTFLIGMPQDTLANDWRKAQVMDVKRELEKERNVKFIYTDAKGSSSTQLMDALNLVEEGIDALIISPADTALAKPVLEEIYDKGIHVILLTRGVQGDAYSTFISADDYLIAQKALKTLAEATKEEAKILMLKGIPTATTTKKREDGFVSLLSHYPKMHIVASYTANYSRTDAIKVMEEFLMENIEFDSIYAQSDSMAEGARIALKANGYDPKKFHIIGIDYIQDAKIALKNKEQIATFTYPTCGKEGAQAALKLLKGESVPKQITIPSQKVTLKNADSIPTVF
jgi:ribose transport system substrate-binding protein